MNAIVRHLIALLMAALCGCGTRGAEYKGVPPDGEFARRLFENRDFGWRIAETGERRLRFYLQRGSDADTAWRDVVGAVIPAQAQVLALLGEPLIPPSGDSSADLFFVGSRADMQRLSGRPLAGFVQPGERTAVFVWSRGYRPPLKHELAHLYTFARWGRPAAGDSAAWLVEGIGAWIGGPCQGQSNHAIASGLLKRNALPSIQDLAQHLRHLPEDVGVPAAGSLVEFLYEREKIDGLKRRWRSSAREALPDPALVSQWRARVAATAPAQLDIAKVMNEGC